MLKKRLDFLTEGLCVIDENERRKMLKAHSIGPKMIDYLDEIGIERLADLKRADPHIIAMRIDIALGKKHMNALGVAAIRNLIALAESEDNAGQNGSVRLKP